jgi:hypothetical protein
VGRIARPKEAVGRLVENTASGWSRSRPKRLGFDCGSFLPVFGKEFPLIGTAREQLLRSCSSQLWREDSTGSATRAPIRTSLLYSLWRNPPANFRKSPNARRSDRV